MKRSSLFSATLFIAGALAVGTGLASANPVVWQLTEWPNTDFEQHSIDYAEIQSGGPRKDGIPPIDDPVFERLENGTATGWGSRYQDNEPVITVSVGDDARAYPLSVMTWHEIVNDTVGGLPLTITYCPLCNAALVFERTVEGTVLDFGTTGKLRNSDLVMYDRQTESWWQQFTGEAIVGSYTGSRLTLFPARLESFALFKERFPDGRVLVPANPGLREYGRNPYPAYDMPGATPFLYQGEMPDGIEPMERVVAVATPNGPEAWSLTFLRDAGEIVAGNLRISWREGQASALDAASVAGGRDVGNVTVQRLTEAGPEDVPYDVTFAFAFHAFRPDSPIYTD
ncbi:MAG: DUF3179 domain-containing protein [Parvibaculaceae bacterium]